MTHYTYLIVDLAAVIVPFLFSFHPKLHFHKQWASLFPAMMITAVFFILWDALFTAMHVWHFNQDYVLGLHIFNLPVEEVLFFFCIPYACLFSYHSIGTLWPQLRFNRRSSYIISWCLIVCCLLAALRFADRNYTMVTAALLFIFISYCGVWKRYDFMGHYYLSYTLMLLPFLIVNGILTGSWIDEPVVLYNPAEIIGLRIMTIPLEDVGYGALLIGLQTFLYERFRFQQSGITA